MAVQAAQITSGHYQGSAQVVVECDMVDGTDIVVYRYVNDVATLVGTGELGNDITLGSGKAAVALTENIAIGNQLVAYVDEQYKQGGDPRIVYEEVTGIKTGWESATTVLLSNGSEVTYEEYTQLGGQEIAKWYAPEQSINNTVDRNNQPPKQFADATLVLQHTTADLGAGVVNVVIATIGNFNPALGSPRIKWDGGAFEQVYQKTYAIAQNGAHTLTVYPENLNYETKTISFTINVAAGTPAPTVTDINAAAYEVNNFNNSLAIIAYSDRQLESRVIGLGTGLFVAMSGGTSRKWQQPAPFLNVPNGTYDVEVRVQGTVAVFAYKAIISF